MISRYHSEWGAGAPLLPQDPWRISSGKVRQIRLSSRVRAPGSMDLVPSVSLRRRYDPAGNLLEETVAEPASGRLLRQRNFRMRNAQVVETERNSEGSIWVTTVHYLDSEGRTTAIERTPVGPASEVRGGWAGATSSSTVGLGLTHDVLFTIGEDPVNRIVITFDDAARLIGRSAIDGNRRISAQAFLRYDERRRLLQEVIDDGQCQSETRFSWDDTHNTVVEEQFCLARLIDRVEYTLDEDGLVSAIERHGDRGEACLFDITRAWDNRGNWIRESLVRRGDLGGLPDSVLNRSIHYWPER